MKTKKSDIMPKQQQRLNEIAKIVRDAKTISIYKLSIKIGINWKTIEIGYVPLLPELFSDIVYDKDTHTFNAVGVEHEAKPKTERPKH